ncbi:probable phosphoglycerate mutase [Acinetobacter marinus]|uniref:Probable phosphoglycerate mutase n=1 Tax=Acinetobacter marinus TaxID=281375 RepID=A0A1G6GHZ8_9GAMM|nr:histidine phosphatase family protein [Acinetobacter marinus]SDB81631.1 probable phosphoglycerate mutase [Acinetobacter marinus]
MDSYWVRVFLVRHGHVNYFDQAHRPINPKFASLSDTGVEQVTTLAELIQDIQFDGIFSSTMPRSIQTAEILNRHAQTIQSYDEIREIRAGRLREISPQHALQLIKYGYCFESQGMQDFLHGERWDDFMSRVVTWFERLLLSTDRQRTFLISSHDVVNRVLIHWVYDQLGRDVYGQEQDYACLNIIDVEIYQGRIRHKRIKLQNYTAYNPVKLNLSQSAMDDVYQSYVQMLDVKN